MKSRWIRTDGIHPLVCLSCGEDFLHHERIEIFSRLQEDSDQGIHVIVDGLEVTINTDLRGNPSSRRNGLRIVCECENCDTQTLLDLTQHKGQTFLEVKPA